ncbi:RagB/SusD family nutrient uptake outer membrane protein [Maribellus comscasis]|uniref:RagB/SusD family nutrient uptake outer membrane protein n=1 Tax=Maribellus comscasis TaxID=2681766 RepID=A0A6I6JL15_9BACT|nr:RagB/SusD family nutrient uptake outer membrane protein [Maribellus comscasis]QGY43486.1 RagB/SusD family nutrient uptake outer membrane protein [Maribellus comscasis]
MKKIYIIPIIISILLFSGCEDYLTTVPSDQYTVENFWSSEEEAQAGLTGVYQVLRGYHANQVLYSSQVTPNSSRFDDPGGWRSLARGVAQTTNPLFQSAWDNNYRGIGRANTVIDNVNTENLKETDTDIIDQIVGEAKFLRAYFYFDLVYKFGGVPLILETPDNAIHGEMGRNERSEVITQILIDLEDAIALLALNNDPGRITKGAAMALKARVLLYEERWSEAASTAQQVINLDKYSLFPNYRGLFMLENENNSEVIWDIQFKLTEFGHGYDDAVDRHSNNSPLKGLVDAYYMTDGMSIGESSMYDPEDPYANRDPRLYQTIRLMGHMYNGNIDTEQQLDQTGFGTKKFTTYSDDTEIAEIPGGQSEVNPIVIRYAEVLLTYAEATNEAEGPVESVYDAINQIRNRPTVDMPDLPTGLTQDEMRQEIRHERRIELAMEGKYLEDIKRWKTAEIELNGPVYDWEGNVYENRAFDPDRDYLWAIPTQEIDLNPNLQQNPGW